MFQNGDEVKVICGDHEGATGTIISIIKGRDLPDGAEVQEPFYIIKLQSKEVATITGECLEIKPSS